ncbi:hypothetical protein C366_06671 [Cryptococcus neoformans Tu401-1]|nr:hypothetical protein C365_06722 [Cryptococcus neoformans var. grubii Bt85]OXG10430.1 hypothetical protein C366_06671 [Cryptococcus neoformans var. grubii Tu401-1]OXM75743.1 hypothetical protein C364_06646 [Cryptococcus neoformans var. grubii Bt63]
MSEPPEYQKLLSKDTESFDVDVEDQAPTYPPGPNSNSMSRVIFVYAPRFGFDDPKEYVGLVGKTKEVSLDSIRRANLFDVNRVRTKALTIYLARPQETIQNMCRYIPELAEYPTDRISFRLSSTGSAHPRNWAVVTEDIWFTFKSDPPEKLGVMVEPTQKDKDANRAKQVKIIMIIIGCFIGFWGLIAAIVAIGDHFFP